MAVDGPNPQATTYAPPASPPGSNPARVLLGLLLVLPALIALYIGQIGPSLWTFAASFQNITPLRSGRNEFVGLEHWTRVLPELLPTLSYALLLGLLPLAVALVVSPALAYAAVAGGRAARWGVRVGLALPMVCFAPLALAIAASWAAQESRVLTSTDTAPWTLQSALFLSTVGLVCGVATTLFVAALGRRPEGRSAAPAAVTVGAVLGLGILSASLQTFTFPYALTGGGPAGVTETPLLQAFQFAFQRFEIGAGAVINSVVLLFAFLFGLAATILVIATRLRATPDLPPEQTRIVPTILAYAGTAVVLVVALFGLWPWLSRLGNEVPADGMATIAGSWLAQLPPALVSVLLAGSAAFGIGVLRPFGRWSEVLLLPFGPWLFVGTAPLATAYFFSAADPGELGLGSPVWLVVPALVGLTILFRGLSERGQQGIGLVVSALPAAGLALVVTWVGHAQDFIWPLVADRDQRSSQVWLASRLEEAIPIGQGPPLAVLLPVPVLVVLFVLLVIAQLGYLDRFALRVGDERLGPFVRASRGQASK